jgi:hypothetical protein
MAHRGEAFGSGASVSGKSEKDNLTSTTTTPPVPGFYNYSAYGAPERLSQSALPSLSEQTRHSPDSYHNFQNMHELSRLPEIQPASTPTRELGDSAYNSPSRYREGEAEYGLDMTQDTYPSFQGGGSGRDA